MVAILLHFMDKIFANGDHVLWYLGDIIIFSDNENEHKNDE